MDGLFIANDYFILLKKLVFSFFWKHEFFVAFSVVSEM